MPRGRGAKKKSHGHGNPAKIAAKKEREMEFRQDGAGKRFRRDRNRRMNRATLDANVAEGVTRGPMTIAAEDVVEEIMAAHGLEGPEHKAAIIEYLVGCFGMVIHAFPDNPEFLPPYLQWRDESAAKVAQAREQLEQREAEDRANGHLL
jgi:hypothetical protein